jgi:hypothetical protein
MAVNEFNISDIPDYAAKAREQYTGRRALEKQVTGYETDYLDRYRRAIMGQENYDALAKRIGEELGLPTLQRNAQQLQTSVRNIPYFSSAAARGFDVNANQLARIIAQKQSELAPLANEAATLAGAAETEAGKRMALVQAQYEKELLPFAYEKGFVADRTARELSGFDRYAEAELNGLIKKAEQGIQLSEGEKNRANELAIAEKKYETELAIQRMKGEQEIALKKTMPDTATILTNLYKAMNKIS